MLTLLITTFNRAALLRNSLFRLLYLGSLPDEILVIDDGSTDATAEMCSEFKNVLPLRYVYRHHPVYDSCVVPRNIGARLAQGDLIMTAEPEILFLTDVIAQMRAAAETHPDHVVSQGVLYLMGRETPANSSRLSNDLEAYMREWDIRPYPEHHAETFADNVVLHWQPVSQWVGLYRREWLMALGGWDEDFALTRGGRGYAWDDIDLLTRLRISGHNQFAMPEMKVVHQWHDKNGADLDGVVYNEEIIKRKHLTESADDPNLVANRGREWGRLICTDRTHPFCYAGLHCRICEAEKNENGHQCA